METINNTEHAEPQSRLHVGLGDVFDIPDFLRNPENLAMERKMEKAKIDKMVDRFLGWRLPKNFNPDAGISFKPEYNVEYMAKQGKPPMRHEPTGTNLFDADQAREMIEYMLAESPNGELNGDLPKDTTERTSSSSAPT